MPGEKVDTPNVRKVLHRMRQRWAEHTPSNPFSLSEEVDNGVTVGEFCVDFLMHNRTQRYTKRETKLRQKQISSVMAERASEVLQKEQEEKEVIPVRMSLRPRKHQKTSPR